MPDDPQLQALNPLMAQGQQPMSGVIPPTSPIMSQTGPPQPGAQNDPLQSQLMQASQMGQQAFEGQLSRQHELAKTVAELQQQQAQTPMPKFGPRIDQGASTLHNVGQVLLMMAGMTGPGKAINQAIYGPGVRQYEAQTGQLSERIKELQGQEQIEEKPMEAAAQLQYRPYMAGAALDRAAAAKQNAQTNAARQAMQESQGLTKIAQGWEKLDLGKQKEKAQEWFNNAVINVSQQRIAAGEDENSARIQAQEDVRSALSQNQWAVQHPFMNALGFSPDIQAPAAAQPTKSAEKSGGANPPAKPGKGPKATHIWTPQGLTPAGKK